MKLTKSSIQNVKMKHSRRKCSDRSMEVYHTFSWTYDSPTNQPTNRRTRLAARIFMSPISLCKPKFLLKFLFRAEILSQNNQVAYLKLLVAYLMGKSIKISWLACMRVHANLQFKKRNWRCELHNLPSFIFFLLLCYYSKIYI